jgi:hypothetical protein
MHPKAGVPAESGFMPGVDNRLLNVSCSGQIGAVALEHESLVIAPPGAQPARTPF